MPSHIHEILWSQFGASIDMLENAITDCPEKLWGDRAGFQEFWYIAYHATFWLDYYLSASPEGFQPPAPFGMEEFDPEGAFPPRVYAKPELLDYLHHCRAKLRARLTELNDDEMNRRWKSGRMDFSILELLLYNMRHVQHHAAQLHLLLRQTTDSAPRWIGKTKSPITPAELG